MAGKDYTKLTSDPILLEALQAPEAELAKTRPGLRSSSRYRGVSKKQNRRSTTWSASVGFGGRDYNLGTYRTEEEAALARNYGDDLLRNPKSVLNVIPTELMPDAAIQKRVALRVVALLKADGALPAATNGVPPQDRDDDPAVDSQPAVK